MSGKLFSRTDRATTATALIMFYFCNENFGVYGTFTLVVNEQTPIVDLHLNVAILDSFSALSTRHSNVVKLR